MLSLRQLTVLFRANLLSSLRNRTAFFFTLVSPVLFFVLFGFIFKDSPASSAGNPDARGVTGVSVAFYLLPGVIVANQLATGFYGGAGVLVAWRERGIFRRIRATPMSVWQLLLARVCSQVLVVFLQALVVVAVGQLVFNVHPVAEGLGWDVLFIVIGALVFQILGQLIAARTKRVETANILNNVLFLPLLFLTDLYIPLSQMPEWLQKIGKVLPPYLVVDLLRTAMIKGTIPANALAEVGGLAVYFVVALVISTLIFRFE